MLDTHTHTLYRLIGMKDNAALLKYSEKRNVLSWLLKEERVEGYDSPVFNPSGKSEHCQVDTRVCTMIHRC